MDISSLMPLLMLMGGGSNNSAQTADYGGVMKTLSEGGGNPMEAIMGMMGGSNPQMRQMMGLMQAFQTMNKSNAEAPKTETIVVPEKKPIAKLQPIKHIAPDRIHNSMDQYLRKSRRVN